MQQTRPTLAAAAIAFAAAFLLCGYELVRSAASTLFMEAYGKDALPIVMAIMPAGVLLMLYGYGRLLSWLGPRRTLLTSSLISGAAILCCYTGIRAGWRPAAGILYVVREAYIVLLVEQYWSFLDSTLGHDRAKTLNGPICGMGSMGAILGASAVQHYATILGTQTMLVFGAAAVIPAALCSDFAYRCAVEDSPTTDAAPKHPPSSGYLGLRLFREHRLLLILLLIIVATQAISTALDLNFNSLLADKIAGLDERTSYQGAFWRDVNICSALAQFAVAPLVLRHLPLRLVHIVIPLVHTAACANLLLHPSLESAALAFLLFKVLDYSIFRSAKEILYIPFSFDVRYRAKEVIDVLGYRGSKGAISLAIAALKNAPVLLSKGLYAGIAAGAALVWLVLAVPLTRRAPE
ncbi:MAG TPA: hypothetical protein VGP72_25370 [Planctomycetota bacterium]|jgi:AAA family ATP:ADP antiporter